MEEQTGIITFQGKPLTLIGQKLSAGSRAPDFTCLDNKLNSVSLKDFAGKACIISSVPSLDTPVCDMETKRFNKEAEKLGDKVKVLTISMDLPFAQARWCGAAGVENVITLSDHKDASFGMAYGVLIKELRLLTRAVFAVDGQGVLRYRQLVKEITKEPDYQAVLDEVAKIL